jgi:biotin transport system substrate-specific component
MHKELAAPLVSSAYATRIRNAGIVVLGSVFVAVCSHVALPLWFTPVPLTMQPFAVVLLGLLLTPQLALAALGAYLVEGALGLPVFAPGFGFGGGLAHLFGPTGGYLLSYPAVAMLISYLWRRSSRGFTPAVISAAIGNLMILLCGFLGVLVFTRGSAQTAFSLAVVPFLPGDALKVVAAAAIASGLYRARRHTV